MKFLSGYQKPNIRIIRRKCIFDQIESKVTLIETRIEISIPSIVTGLKNMFLSALGNVLFPCPI